MKTYYVTGSNGKVYRVKVNSPQIAAIFVSKMYHVSIVAVE